MNSVHEQYPNSDLNSVQVATHPSSLPQVATPTKQARSRPQEQQARSRRQSMSRPPGRPSLCRDINFMSRHQSPTGQVVTSVPCRDLPHCRPCRDVKMMSRHQIISASSLLRRNLPCCQPCRDLKMMSRHQAQLAISCYNSARSQRPFPGRDLASIHTKSRPQPFQFLLKIFFFISISSLHCYSLHAVT